MHLRPQLVLLAPALLALAACEGAPDAAATAAKSAGGKDIAVFEGPVPRAVCGPGSQPETDLQGRVPIEDRESGRSAAGYRCNLEMVGQYQGQGTTWVSQSYGDCAYHSQAAAAVTSPAPGVHVVDARDPAHPFLSTRLTSPGVLFSTWESLKVNERRGLLGGVNVGPQLGAAFFDVYDLTQDCADPVLLNSFLLDSLSLPANGLGHEGGWSPDGNTYWASSSLGGMLTAIDVSDPAAPRIVYTGNVGNGAHGFELSEDGNRLYMAGSREPGAPGSGLIIFDVSEVQARAPMPQVHALGTLRWTDGYAGQHAIPVSWGGRPYVVFVDELSGGMARVIDIADEAAPVVVSKLKLEIHMPEAEDLRRMDLGGNGIFGYDGHYCAVDRKQDPTALACGYFQSGLRVFDVRDPMRPREIAYFNPPAQVGKAAQLVGSEHARSGMTGAYPDVTDTRPGAPSMTADWCSSPPRFVTQPDGEQQLWAHCQDNGFMVLKFTNGAYPIGASPPVDGGGDAAAEESAFGGALPAGLLLVLLGPALGRGRAARRGAA